LYVTVGGLVVSLLFVGVGLLVVFIVKVKDAQSRSISNGNLKQICLALNNVAGKTPAQSYIPPAFGVFPNGGTVDATFFFHLTPYIEQNTFYSQYSSNPAAATVAVRSYVVPADSYNPGTSNLCSYAANANFLAVTPEGNPPRLTDGGRTSTTIIVAERSAKTGAVWNAYTPASFPGGVPSGPFFYVYYPATANPAQTYAPVYTESANWPSTALGTSPPTALSRYGIMVGMLDGSARIVSADSTANNAWLIACDPVNNPGPMPSNW
jgi:hypothetical protein